MNNIDIANFDKMLELAEFGAKRHNERRQNLFKAVIAYITLLVLFLYQTFKENEVDDWIPGVDSIEKNLVIILLVIILLGVHFVYLWWLWTTSVASINDVRRRDFYLKKAEALSYHLSRSRFSSFGPDPCKYVKLNMGSGKSWKIPESCLFNMKEPVMVTGNTSTEEPPDPVWYRDIHFWSLSVLPTLILLLLMVKLVGIYCTT